MKSHSTDLSNDKTIKRILVIRWSAMGDLIICSTIFEDIANAFPDSDIHLNTLPSWKYLFDHDPRFNKVIYSNVRGAGLRGIINWIKEIRAGNYDLIIDLQNNDRTHLLMILLRLSGNRTPWRVGNCKYPGYNLYPDKIAPQTMAIDMLRATISSAGIIAKTPRPVLHVQQKNIDNVNSICQQHGLIENHFIILMPGSQARGHLKRWGASRYANLAHQLHRQGVGKIVLIGGPDDIDECKQVEQACDEWLVNLCGKTEILDIVPLSQKACYIISNDTGTAHVASATSRPIIVICGPTDPKRVKPCGDNVRTIQADLPCINCYLKECSHHSCMKAITPELITQLMMKKILAPEPCFKPKTD